MSRLERSAGTRGNCPFGPRFARERISVPPLEERFFDLNLPLDSDFLEDMEAGSLFDPPSISGKEWPRGLDVNRRIIEEALDLAREKGVPSDLVPRFRVIRGAVHACSANGRMLRLDHSLFWERDSGYDAMLDELLDLPPVDHCAMPSRGKIAGQ